MKKNLILFMALLFTMTTVSAKNVIYNKETNIYHDPDCLFAKQCTKNCVSIDVTDAIEKKGKPCEKCRTEDENWNDMYDYNAKKRAEEKKRLEEERRKYLNSPGIKKQGNYTFEIKKKK